MSDYSGRKVRYGLAHETSRGTFVASAYWLRWETADFFDNATTTFNQSAIGVLDRYSGAEIMQKSAAGQLAGKITDLGFGLILYGAFGGYAHAAHAGETVVFDHTFTEDQSNTSQSLAICRLTPNDQTNYVNAMVGSLAIEAKAGDFVRHTTNFTSFPGVTGTGATSTFVAENEFKAKHVVAKLATNIAGIGAATAIPVASFTLNINKNLDPYYIIGQDGPSEIFAQNVEVTGEFVLRYTDSTYFTQRFANTKQALVLAIANTDVTIGSTTNPSVTFTMPTVYLNDFKPDQGIDGMVTQTVSFTAAYDLSTAYAIRAVLTNTLTAY